MTISREEAALKVWRNSLIWLRECGEVKDVFELGQCLEYEDRVLKISLFTPYQKYIVRLKDNRNGYVFPQARAAYQLEIRVTGEGKVFNCAWDVNGGWQIITFKRDIWEEEFLDRVQREL